MHKNNYRVDRVAEQIKKELATIMQFQLKDPRIGMVSLMEVKVSRDYSHAQIYFSLLDKDELKSTLEALESASKFLRSALAKSMKNMRIVPHLHFHYDNSLERGNHLSALIDKAIASDEADKKLFDEEE